MSIIRNKRGDFITDTTGRYRIIRDYYENLDNRIDKFLETY